MTPPVAKVTVDVRNLEEVKELLKRLTSDIKELRDALARISDIASKALEDKSA